MSSNYPEALQSACDRLNSVIRNQQLAVQTIRASDNETIDPNNEIALIVMGINYYLIELLKENKYPNYFISMLVDGTGKAWVDGREWTIDDYVSVYVEKRSKKLKFSDLMWHLATYIQADHEVELKVEHY